MKMPGSHVLAALENGVSQYPSTAGRFLQVSGLKFTFDPMTDPRVQTVEIAGEPLDMHKIYSVATKAYIANGYDGYEAQFSKTLFRFDAQTCRTGFQKGRKWEGNEN